MEKRHTTHPPLCDEEVSCDNTDPSSQATIDLSDLDDRSKTIAIEVVMPTSIAIHVERVLSQRGIALNDFVIDLFAKFVPGAVEKVTSEHKDDCCNSFEEKGIAS